MLLVPKDSLRTCGRPRTSVVAPFTGPEDNPSRSVNGTELEIALSHGCAMRALSPPTVSSSPANYLFPSVSMEPNGVEETVVIKFYDMKDMPFQMISYNLRSQRKTYPIFQHHVKNLT